MLKDEMTKNLNRMVTGDAFLDENLNEYIYASLSQPPIKIVNKNNSGDEMDYTVKCPTCGNEVNYGTEIFMLSGHLYCVKDGCRDKLLHILGKRSSYV